MAHAQVIPGSRVARAERREAGMGPSGAALALFVLVLAVVGVGCPCLSGAVNASPALRWFLFSNYGASRICPEMLKSGVPLRLQDNSPTIGRFFPVQCSYNVDDTRKVVTVHMNGTGYGYMLPFKRIGFTLSASVEYRPDFQIAGDDVYVWGRFNRTVNGPNFQLGYVENPAFAAAANIPPFGNMANAFGNIVVASVMTRGFTVIHNEDRGNDFTLGTLFPPQRPNHPYDVSGSERFTFANETTEVQTGSRDFLGPFEVTEQGQAIFFSAQLQGPAVEVMVVDRHTGDAWRDHYQRGYPLGPPPGPVLGGGPLQPGYPANLRFPLQPGQYYLVVDHTAQAGAVNPPMISLNPLARISYVAQLGE